MSLSFNLNSHFDKELQRHLIDALLQLSSIQIFLMVLTSISRVVAIGAHEIMYAHVAIMVILVSFYGFRHRLSVSVKSHNYVFISTLAGLFGLFSFGLVGGGFIYLIYSCICSCLLLTIRFTLFYFALAVFAILINLYLANIEKLQFAFSTEAYNTSFNSWLSALLMAIFVIVNVGYCLLYIRHYCQHKSQ